MRNIKKALFTVIKADSEIKELRARNFSEGVILLLYFTMSFNNCFCSLCGNKTKKKRKIKQVLLEKMKKLTDGCFWSSF